MESYKILKIENFNDYISILIEDKKENERRKKI